MELQGRKYKPNQTDRDYAQHEEGCDKEQRETANMYTKILGRVDTPGSAAEQNLSDKLGTGARVGRHKVNKHGDITDFQRYRNKTRTD